jgi:fumarylacetoacetase
MASWLPIPAHSPFSLANVPFGVISTSTTAAPVPAVAVGEYALNLAAFAASGGFSALPIIQPHLSVFHERVLNAFAALGRPVHRQVREYLQAVFRSDTPFPQLLRDNAAVRKDCLVPLAEVTNQLPLRIGAYTDFYCGLNHALNVGTLIRGPVDPLQPNYRHLPVAYHSRASSVVVSGTPVRRPIGQIVLDPTATPPTPVLSPSRRLDLELELAVFVAHGNPQGEPVPINKADDHLFGMVLMNDWSARDIQAWEYVPLGPFNSKNFATSISPWVILMDALEPFRTPGLEPGNRTSILPYLRESRADNCYDIRLEYAVKTAAGASTTLARTNASNYLFSFGQMLTHHTVGGCNMDPGDLIGGGTISGSEPGTEGCLIEQTRIGKVPVRLSDGTERYFLEDGDEVTLRGIAGEEGAYVGFGDCVGVILPAHSNAP